MSSLYEEAVADAARLRELALRNATSAVMESVTPRMRKMIDDQLLREDAGSPVDVKDDDDDILLGIAGGNGPDGGDVSLDAPGSEPAGISLPDAEGKITIDLDDFVVPEEGEEIEVTGVAAGPGIDDLDLGLPGIEGPPEEDEEMYLSAESARLLSTLLGRKDSSTAALKTEVRGLTEATKRLRKSTRPSPAQIQKTLRKVKHTYWCVREARSITSKARALMENRLETLYEALKGIQGNRKSMARRRRSRLFEDDLKVTIAGLPDEVEADQVSVDVEDAEEDEEGDDDLGDLGDLGGDEDMGEAGLYDTDMYETDEMDETSHKDEMDEMSHKGETSHKDEDMRYETDINENDLEITIAGLPDEVDADEVSVDVHDAEEDEMGDEMGDEEGGDLDLDLNDNDVVEIDEKMLRQEVARMRRIHVRRLAEETAPNAGGAGVGPNEYDDYGDATEEAELFVDYDDGDLNKLESVRRRNRRRRIREMHRRRQARGRRPQARSGNSRLAESRQQRQRGREVSQLRKALSEANLFNAKMVYANKLLQREGLNDRQKARIVENLDRACSIREVKLLYRGLVSAITKRKPVNEGRRRVLGSGSRAGRSGGATRKVLDEGVKKQVDRWGLLAGIKEAS